MKRRPRELPLLANLDPRADAIERVRAILETRRGSSDVHSACFTYSARGFLISIRLTPEDAREVESLCDQYKIKDVEIAEIDRTME